MTESAPDYDEQPSGLPGPERERRVPETGAKHARNVAANWLGYMVVLVTGFVLPRFIDDHQSREMLGIWDLGWSLVHYVLFLSLGVGSAVNRYVARHRAVGDWAALNATASSCLLVLSMSFGAAALVTGAFVALVPRLVPDVGPEAVTAARWTVLFLAFTAALKLPFGVLNGVITGYERFDLLNLIRGCRDIIVLGLMLTLLLTGRGIVSLAFVVLCGEAVSDAIKIRLVQRLCPQLRFSIRLARWPVVREVVGFGSKTVLKGAARGGMYQLNGILVSFFLGPATLAVYARQRALVMHGMRFLRKYALVFVPTSGALHASGDTEALRKLLVQTSRYGFYIALPLVVTLVVMGGPLLHLWMGADYQAPLVLAIFALGHVLTLPQQSAYSVLMGMGRHGLPSVLELIAALVSVVLGAAALSLGWGMVGAALALAVPMTLSSGLVQPVYACRLLDLGVWRYARSVVPGPAAAAIPFALCLVSARWFCADAPLRALGYGLGLGGVVLAGIYWTWVLPAPIRARIQRRLGGARGERPAPAVSQPD